MEVTIQEAQVITIQEPIVIEDVRDLFTRQRIIAKIKGLPRYITLWDGPEEYEAAGNWTNDSALIRAKEVLSVSPIVWG
jgi:hypothetical protein